MHPFISGFFFGFIFLFALGPAFFALIQTSIQQGFRKAAFLVAGISLSDTLYVFATLYGLSSFMEESSFKFWMAVFGVVVLIVYAAYSWYKVPLIQELETGNEKSFLKYFFRGLLLNGLNPFMIVSWAAWISTISINFDYSLAQKVQFFIGMLICIFCLDLGKAFLANRLKYLITNKSIRLMNKFVAVIIMVFTIRICYFIYELY